MSETPGINESPATGESPADGETPGADETPGANESPYADETPGINESPATGESPADVEMPVAGETPAAAELHPVAVSVNGQTYRRAVEARLTLADFIRDELGLTGTHIGCEHGVCGACTVLFNGAAVRSCLLLAVQADGAALETVESLAPADGGLNPLQQAFQERHALQCGFCTPGMLLTATALLRENPRPTRAEAREAIAGNLCRCTGYAPIISAIVQTGQGG